LLRDFIDHEYNRQKEEPQRTRRDTKASQADVANDTGLLEKAGVEKASSEKSQSDHR
jgi:hypothetical protein